MGGLFWLGERTGTWEKKLRESPGGKLFQEKKSSCLLEE